METVPNEKLNESEKLWLISVFTAAWIILTPVLFSTLPKVIVSGIFSQNTHKGDDKHAGKLIETEKSKDTEPDSNIWFLSTKNQKESGKLTKNKGFEAKTKHDKLRISRAGESEKSSGQKLIESLSAKESQRLQSVNEVKFEVQIMKEKQLKGSGKGDYNWGNASITTIPENYNFRNNFAFSWNKDGEPQVPTVFFKHYEYFKSMFRKLYYHWYPPGGKFRERVGYSRTTPGITTYTPFPEQDVWVLFMIDSNGNYLDARIYKSMGYKELDSSILDAFSEAGSFGPPPRELLDNGVLIIGVIWRYF